MRTTLQSLKQIARDWPDGFLDSVIADAKSDGEWIEIDDGKLAGVMRKYRGLGDVVAAVAKPIARVIDAAAGTDLQNCGGCKQRQEDWNKAFPLAD